MSFIQKGIIERLGETVMKNQKLISLSGEEAALEDLYAAQDAELTSIARAYIPNCENVRDIKIKYLRPAEQKVGVPKAETEARPIGGVGVGGKFEITVYPVEGHVYADNEKFIRALAANLETLNLKRRPERVPLEGGGYAIEAVTIRGFRIAPTAFRWNSDQLVDEEAERDLDTLANTMYGVRVKAAPK